MKHYWINIKGVPTNIEDIYDNPIGDYYISAESEDLALDELHQTTPIACLDDFTITIEEIKP